MNDYFFITKLAISWALIKDRTVVFEKDKKLFIGKFVRVSKNRNAIIEIEGKEYCLRKKWVCNMAILISKKDCEVYDDWRLHGFAPSIKLDWLEVCTVYPSPRCDETVTAKRIVQIWFPYTADQAIETFDEIIKTIPMTMKCPKCQEEGKKSTVQSLGGRKTLLGWGPKYDEEGVFHSHDPNTCTSYYKCSNGHEFIVQGKPLCPNCEYGKDTIKVITR